MSDAIPESYRDLFKKKAFANIASILPNGRPHVTPVWVDFDGKNLLVNTAKGRVKDKNMRANKWVALAIQDPDNPYRYLGIRGRVVESIEGGAADAHIDKMAKKYTGQDKYPWRAPGEVRVLYKIKLERVIAQG